MLRQRADEALRRGEFLAQRHEELAPLSVALALARARLGEPMRVAVAGMIKRGKSTLANALLGGDVSPTGVEETTYHVVEFRHGDRSSFAVCYRDGRVERVPDVGELHRYVSRLAGERAALGEIRRILVTYPSPLLTVFRVLDVPGLGSVFEADSLNAMERLGIDPREVTGTSLEEVDQADAVVYLFNRAMSVSDADIIREFGGPALKHLSPVKAIGVLSRVDDYWPPRRGVARPEAYDPLERGSTIAARYVTTTRAADIFYDIKPVIAKLALGAATASDADLGDLRVLGGLDPGLLFQRVRDAQLFATRTFADVPVDTARRAELVRTFGAYGVYLGTQLARTGADDQEIRATLTARSGVNALRDVITSHFGNRADLIKVATILGHIEAERTRLRPLVIGPAATALADIGRTLGQLRASEHGFRELDALHYHYQLRAERRRGQGNTVLSDTQTAEFLRVTGEHGTTCAERLSCPTTASTEELLDKATKRLAHWRQAALDPTLNRAVLPLVQFLTVAYELLCYHVHEAQRHLAFEEDSTVR